MILVSKSVLFFPLTAAGCPPLTHLAANFIHILGNWGRGIGYLDISAEKVAGCASVVAKCMNLFVMALQSMRLKSQSLKTQVPLLVCVCNKCCSFPKLMTMPSRAGTAALPSGPSVPRTASALQLS